MTRDEAIIKLRLLVGKDLRPLAALVQARTKSEGDGRDSHAFYAQEKFVAKMLRLDENKAQ